MQEVQAFLTRVWDSILQFQEDEEYLLVAQNLTAGMSQVNELESCVVFGSKKYDSKPLI